MFDNESRLESNIFQSHRSSILEWLRSKVKISNRIYPNRGLVRLPTRVRVYTANMVFCQLNLIQSAAKFRTN